eukprot:TRINITY_DN3709_c0_g3_i5.p1 TRINITY_DN3709_c0_g3~~TRINITY_DN3709_c0_g3_i5.p1  ORF type:complete len:420 (+),score=153.66 TRINITY_DN3709_c0_g3_i5:92-1351(+)
MWMAAPTSPTSPTSPKSDIIDELTQRHATLLEKLDELQSSEDDLVYQIDQLLGIAISGIEKEEGVKTFDKIKKLEEEEIQVAQNMGKTIQEICRIRQEIRKPVIQTQRATWFPEDAFSSKGVRVETLRRNPLMRMTSFRQPSVEALQAAAIAQAKEAIEREKDVDALEQLNSSGTTVINGKILELSEFEVDPQALEDSNERIGSGSFGEVYRGTYMGSEVAIKKLKVGNLSSQDIKDFAHEVRMMSRLRHPNIIILLGACTKPEKLCMVTELMPRGSVADYLNGTNSLTLLQKMMICKQTAQAVNWMHNLSPPVLHLDLKPANLLLDKHFNVKVADFGLSMLKVQNLEVANGSPYFMCPEMFEKKEITEKADVYSFGILIWEIMTEGVPYSENPRIRDIESYFQVEIQIKITIFKLNSY